MNPDLLAWDRQPGEGNQWFSRFEKFRLLGPGRSILAAYTQEREEKASRSSKKLEKKPQNSSEGWRKAAKEWNWVTRAEAWDEHWREQERKAYEQREWDRLERWNTIRDRVLEEAQEAIAAVNQMALHPLVEEEHQNIAIADHAGQEIPQQIVVKPVGFNASTPSLVMLRAVKAAKLVTPDEKAAIKLLSGLGYEIYDGDGNAVKAAIAPPDLPEEEQ